MRNTLLFICLFFSFIAAAQKKPVPPDRNAFKNKTTDEYLNAWVEYCDLFVGNQEGYAEDYEGLKLAAQKGLEQTPPNEYYYLSTFNYFLGACNRNRMEARQYYVKAIDFAQKANNVKKVVTATSAILSEYEDDAKAAEPYRDILLAILDTVKDNGIKINIYYGLGFFYENISWFETSLTYQLKMLELRKDELEHYKGDERMAKLTNFGVTLNHVAVLYMELEQTDKALDYYRQSLAYFVNYKEAFEDSWKGMITAFSTQHKTDSVYYYYSKLSASALKEPQNFFALTTANMAMADAALNRKETDSAALFLSAAHSFMAKIDFDKKLEFQWWVLKAKLDLALGSAASLPELKKRYDEVEKGDINEFSDLNRTLAEMSMLVGDTKNAGIYYAVYTKLSDSLTKQKISRNIAEKEARYQNVEKQSQINAQREQLSDIRRKQTILLTAISLLVTVLALLFVIYRNKKRTAALLNEKNENLSVLNQKLEEANRTKAKLFSIISHDLRSPISQVYQFLKLQQLRPDLLSEEQKSQLNEKIQTATGTLLETMEDLLLWSKTQVNSINPSVESFDLSQLISNASKLVSLNIESKKMILQNNLPTNLMVHADPDFMQTIVRNLLQNAIKAAPENSTITVNAQAENGQVRLSISNEGSNFSMQDFQKIISASGDAASLSGLGLKLVWELSQKINVQVGFESIGGRTTAVLNIPQ